MPIALDIELIKKEILDVIKTHDIKFIKHIFLHYDGCSREHFYKNDLHIYTPIKKAIDKNRNKKLNTILDKLEKSENVAAHIFTAKYFMDDDDIKRINGTSEIEKKTDDIKRKYTRRVVSATV